MLWISAKATVPIGGLSHADAEMNIFERAKQLAETGRPMDAIIKALKAERYENVEAFLSPSFRRQLRQVREAAKQTSK